METDALAGKEVQMRTLPVAALAAVLASLLITGALSCTLGGGSGGKAVKPTRPRSDLLDELEGWTLAYVAAPQAGGPTYLFAANADGTDARQIDHLGGEKHQPYWSPDGGTSPFAGSP